MLNFFLGLNKVFGLVITKTFFLLKNRCDAPQVQILATG